jgi:hypothetical protein
MDFIQHQRQLMILYQAGFTQKQIDRLTRLRNQYLKYGRGQDRSDPDLAHLRFMRWLVEHGRLTEQLLRETSERQ